jgi:group II intron reverse transcriptase/maturase
VKLKDTKNYDDSRQLHIEGYSQEDRVELEVNEKAPSNSLTSKKKQDDRNAYDSMLLEKILDKENMNIAFKRVKKNKGSHGIDRLTTDELLEYLKEHGAELKEHILEGTYSPKAVRRVEIPKDNGGKRKLGIPTVVDRVVQQAITQTLSPIFEEVFSDNSFGFRPNRSAHDALKSSKGFINNGYKWSVDLDLKAYFDTVNHDKLIGLIYKEVKDIRVISLIRKYLQAGVMDNDVFNKTQKGVPQGGPLSPLLSNIMLNELDKELERRNLHFVRYADDCNIYVKSKKAANRVMSSITDFIETKLKLVVNKEKSSVGRPWKLKFLGYSFYLIKGGVDFRVHKKSIKKLKTKLKYLTGRSRIGNIKTTFRRLKEVIVGWVNYFKMAKMKTILKMIDEWLRRRIRMCYWKQWKKVRTKFTNLKKLGINNGKAWEFANTRKGYWRISSSPILNTSITNTRLKKTGLISFSEVYAKVS